VRAYGYAEDAAEVKRLQVEDRHYRITSHVIGTLKEVY
jgi:hypothetical protein